MSQLRGRFARLVANQSCGKKGIVHFQTSVYEGVKLGGGGGEVWLLFLKNVGGAFFPCTQRVTPINKSTPYKLRHCARNRQVAGSILDCVIEIFHWHNPSGRTMALESTQSLTRNEYQEYFLAASASG
jgi:hypothetical protein